MIRAINFSSKNKKRRDKRNPDIHLTLPSPIST
jgi:hypothetical protein